MIPNPVNPDTGENPPQVTKENPVTPTPAPVVKEVQKPVEPVKVQSYLIPKRGTNSQIPLQASIIIFYLDCF